MFTDRDTLNHNPRTLSTSECHAVVRQATPPKRTDPSDISKNHIYDIDEQDDALSNEMCDHGSYDNDILNERIRATLPNGVSGVVGSPTRIDDIDTAGCNVENFTVSDAGNGGAGCNAEKLAMSDAPVYINANDIHIYTNDHAKCDMNNNTHNNITNNSNNVCNVNKHNENVTHHESHKRKRWSKAIAMYGTINDTPALILFDPGAEGNFISETLINKHNITTQHSDDLRIGLRYDGGARPIDRIALNINIRVQQYTDTIELHASPLAQYDVILGVPWHEMVDAHTHHRQRTITLSTTDSNGDVTRITLKQQRRDKRLQRDISNDISCNDSILISAVQLKRWMRARSSYNDGMKIKQQPPMIYLIHVNTIDAKNEKQSNDDKYQQQYTSLYPDVCSDIPPGLPPQRAYDHHIVLEANTQPTNQPAYRASAADNDEIRKQVNEMLDKGWIQPSTSSFASPVLLVKKHDGSMTMCVDYRALNKLTVKDRYPLPHTDELTDRLSRAKYLTKLDLRAGYHQVRIAEDDIKKTAFITRYGLYEYLVMPFGLCNAPSTFMRMMNDILRPLLDVCVIVFIDDILIYSETEDQHRTDVCRVFDLLRHHKLYVKLSKCEFFRQHVEFLGHIVGNGQIKMCPGKVDAILQWPIPTSVTDVRSFLGLCNYYRKFIRGFSTIASPLTDITKSDNAFTWSPKQQLSFDHLKRAITSAPVLQLPNQSLKWILYTDASGFAVGGVLCQPVEDSLKPVIFLSHKLSGAELNWPVYEKEFYAIVYCLKQCQWYLQGNDVIIYTDHKSLQYFTSQKALQQSNLDG